MFTSATILRGIAALIIDEALSEPAIAPVCAMMCSKLSNELPEFKDGFKTVTFRRILLNLCQVEIENMLDREALAKMDKEAAAEEELKMRRRFLGNTRFFGELYLNNMLTEKIMHQCLTKLIADISTSRPDLGDSGDSGAFFDNIETLSVLFITIGKRLESTKATRVIDRYFDEMRALAETEMPSMYTVMLKDVIDLRAASWEPRSPEFSSLPSPTLPASFAAALHRLSPSAVLEKVLASILSEKLGKSQNLK
jgi:translation initiation factor 4G